MPNNGILQGKAEMKRIYERAAEWLCGIGSDKYVHLLTCLVLTFVMGKGLMLLTGEPHVVCAAIGAGAAMMAGCCKEWYDSINNGEFGAADLLADAVGCMLGLAMTVL